MSSTPRLQIPVGSSDFRKLREAGMGYVDKTDFVRDAVLSPAEVLLFPRPRRFGKTVNLSTLRYFVEKSDEDRSGLFAGLSVWESEAARRHFGRHPMIWLTFKDVKAGSFEAMSVAVRQEVGRAYEEHRYLLSGGGLDERSAHHFSQILLGEGSDPLYWGALRDLSAHLYRHHGERVVILIDEYDSPLHTASVAGYFDRAVELFRNLLSGGLKDNASLFKGVLTGILRVAKESIFSGLNNLRVYSVLLPEFASSFGFTEEDVANLLSDAGQPELLDGIRSWYNGYLFGGKVVYNPWSVMNFLTSQDHVLRPYWVATASNDLLASLLFQHGMGLRGELETLLEGGSVEKVIEDHVVLRDLDRVPGAVWSFLLYSGYLSAVESAVREGRQYAMLAIPNREVFAAFEDLVRSFMQVQTGGDADRMLKALLAGDERTFERDLQHFLLTSMSYHDPAGREPERVYHAFVLGLLVHLRPHWEVKSNGESGFGRYDVMVLPREAGRPGVVLELKTVDDERGETAEQALESALAQIEERQYATALRERGAAPIHEIAAVFDGRRVSVRRVERTGTCAPPDPRKS